MNQGHLESIGKIFIQLNFFLKNLLKKKLNYLFEEYNYSALSTGQ